MSESATHPASRRAALSHLAIAALALASASAGCGASGGRFTALEENDAFDLGNGLGTDRDYTQGAIVAATLTDADTPGWARDAARALPLFGRKGAPVHLGVLFGQEIYTPGNIDRPGPIPDDRPYAAWAYAGFALQSPLLDASPERRRDRQDGLELDIGAVGRAAGGERIQNAVHRSYGVGLAQGWDNQVGGEAGVLLSRESRWRLAAGGIGGGGGWGWDFLPRARAWVGNVRDDATLGAETRVGWNLPRDFGLEVVDSTGLRKGSPSPRPWLAFTGRLEGRVVAYDVFLQGDRYGRSPSVTPETFPYQSVAGISAGWGPFSASYEQHWLSPEFRERSRHHKYGTLVASWTWFF